MTDKPVRPRFDDPLPGEGGPHQSREPFETGGPLQPIARRTPLEDMQRADESREPQVPGDPVPLLSDPSVQATQVMLDPTVARMTLLLSSLVLLTENGDLALWASLMTLDRVLRGLDWGRTPSIAKRRYFSLIQVTLLRYAQLIHEHVEHLTLIRDGEPDPPMPAWPSALSAEMYDLVDVMLPSEATDSPAEERP